MYRIIWMANKPIAVELFTSGRDAQDEFDEMKTFVEEGLKVVITDNYLEYTTELITRDYL